jgi:chromosomal replication initiator protein
MSAAEDARSVSITIELIQRSVAAHYGLTEEQLLNRCLSPVFSRPRQVAMYLARTLTGAGFEEIGRRFGTRNSTTALRAVRRIRDLAEREVQIGRDVRQVESLLREAASSKN